MDNKIPNAGQILKLSDEVIFNWHEIENKLSSNDDFILQPENDNDLQKCVVKLSMLNTCLWHEEDKARDIVSSDSAIAAVKRLIDKLNARRVNEIEEIDNIIYHSLPLNENSPLNTETPGSVIDRITILQLKKYHMNAETERADASAEFRERCREKLAAIKNQMNDLCSAYDALIGDLKSGKRQFRLYRQFKMYNDPELNPVLYKKR